MDGSRSEPKSRQESRAQSSRDRRRERLIDVVEREPRGDAFGFVVEQGAVAVRDVREVFALEAVDSAQTPTKQPSLFD